MSHAGTISPKAGQMTATFNRSIDAGSGQSLRVLAASMRRDNDERSPVILALTLEDGHLPSVTLTLQLHDEIAHKLAMQIVDLVAPLDDFVV